MVDKILNGGSSSDEEGDRGFLSFSDEEDSSEGSGTFKSVSPDSTVLYEFPAASERVEEDTQLVEIETEHESPSDYEPTVDYEFTPEQETEEPVFTQSVADTEEVAVAANPAVVAAAASPQRASSSGLLIKMFAAFLAGGLIASLGFGAAFWTFERKDATSDDTPSSSAQSASAFSQNSVAGKTPLIDVEGGEPAIFVAEALGPSIVQIETEAESGGFSLGDGFAKNIGSGVVYKNGLVITNQHVVDGATSVSVRQSNGRLLEGEVVGSDERIDIAVVKIDPPDDLPIAQLSEDEVRVGQMTVAIGSPFELQQTVTDGIVSAVNRPLRNPVTGNFRPMIQTNAAINPGNSGGALADIQGRVIGINTAIQTDGQDTTNAGIGYAIPIDLVVRIADSLVAGEQIESGVLGVEGSSISTSAKVGVELVRISPDSAAAKAGLKVGDRILTVNDAPVSSFEQLAGLISVRQPGDEVTLQVARGDNLESIEITAVLGTST